MKQQLASRSAGRPTALLATLALTAEAAHIDPRHRVQAEPAFADSNHSLHADPDAGLERPGRFVPPGSDFPTHGFGDPTDTIIHRPVTGF